MSDIKVNSVKDQELVFTCTICKSYISAFFRAVEELHMNLVKTELHEISGDDGMSKHCVYMEVTLFFMMPGMMSGCNILNEFLRLGMTYQNELLKDEKLKSDSNIHSDLCRLK